MPNFSSEEVLVTAANILYAPLGTALPDETTVAWGAYDSWTGWEHVGYTATPARTTYSYDIFELMVEQSTAPILQRKQNERAVTDFALSQFNADNLKLLLDGTVTATAAGASQKPFTKIVTGGGTALQEYMLALEGFRPDDDGNEQPVRIFFYRGTARVNGSIELAKAAGTSLPGQFTALLDSSKALGAQLMEIHIVTGPVTA